MNIRKWLENIASVFQPTYDRIKAWQLSPEVDKLLEDLWNSLPAALQGSLYKFIKEIYDTYGKEFAEEIIKKIMAAIKKQIT